MRSMLCLALALVGVSVPPPAPDTLVIRDVSVLPMTSAVILPHRTVMITGGRIASVSPADSAPLPQGATVVDGRGRYLIPGLADMHVHLSGTEELPMYLQKGVLTVRDLNGSLEKLAWRRAIDADSLLGPRLIVSSPLLAGKEIPWLNKLTPTTRAEADSMVTALHAEGFDLIKIYDGLPREAFEGAMAAAKRLHMLSTGHIPADVGFAGVLASGMTGLEHLDKTVWATVDHSLDTMMIPVIADSIRRAGMWVTPTLESMIQLALIGSGRYDSLVDRPEARAAPADLRSFWNTVTARLKGNRKPGPGIRYNPWTDYQMRLAGALARAGVPLLAGTDLPNAVLVPGTSLLGELDALVEAGLTRYQALEAATSAPARFMRQERDWGTIAAGQRANLVLLDANPLQGFATLRSPVGIVRAGRWYDAAALARLYPLERR